MADDIVRHYRCFVEIYKLQVEGEKHELTRIFGQNEQNVRNFSQKGTKETKGDGK